MSKMKLSRIDRLKNCAKALPKSSGCYLFLSKNGDILYVGKAKNLRSRVQSYFNSDHKGSVKTRYLVEKIEEINFQLTESDIEAFILENNLIKKHRPKYNIRLKDDTSYPYIIVDKNHHFPRLEYRRRVKKDQSREVFGPFVHGSNIANVLREVIKAFQLRDCTDREFNSRKEPCLLYQMKQCSGPCVELISKANYKKDLSDALAFFQGKGDRSLKKLEKKMNQLSQNEQFEQAALLRDSIFILQEFVHEFSEAGAKISLIPESLDVICFYESESEVDLSIHLIREGVSLGQKSFNFNRIDWGESLIAGLMNFCFQYYESSKDVLPKSIYCQSIEKDYSLLSSVFEEIFSQKISFISETKEIKKIVSLNQEQAFQNYRIRSLDKEHHSLALKKIQSLLNLKEVPRKIECFDVAIWQGKSPTGSQVVFFDGLPERESYRYYHLEERPEGNNDFAMLRELLERRLKKGKLPDLFVVDGGMLQVNVFKNVLQENSIEVPVVGIAKSRTKSNFASKEMSTSLERLVIENRKDPYNLSKSTGIYRLFTAMRDEAHRFSRKLHHKKEEESFLSSWFDDIPGVGAKTKQKILKNLDVDWKELKKYNVEELQSKLGVGPKVATMVMKKLGRA